MELFIASTNPTAGREDDYNRWYDDHHIHEMVDDVDGFVSGQRFRLSETATGTERPGGWRYLALYDLAIDDVNAAFASHQRTIISGTRTPSDGAIDPAHTGYVYTPIGEAVTRDGWTGRAHASHIRLVRVNAAPGRDAEFEQWHDRHAQAALGQMSGCMGVRRYRLHTSQRPDETPAQWRYLLLYELLTSGPPPAFSWANGSPRSLAAVSGGVISEDYTDELFAALGPCYAQCDGPAS